MNRRIIIIVGCIVASVFLFFIVTGKKKGVERVSGGKRPVRQGKGAAVGRDNAPGLLSAEKLFALAQHQEGENKLLKARESYEQILSLYPGYRNIEKAQKKLEEINVKIIFSPSVIGEDGKYYEVRPGDNLNKIARKFATTVGMIKRINGLKSDIIRPRMRLKIWTGKFSVLVDKSQNALMLKSGDKIVKTYTVATGKNNSTPVGKFKIVNKLVDPVWFKPGVAAVVPPTSPENALGSRWMGLDIPGYGIHGTRNNNSLGLQVTEGCIRLSNKDVEELYSILPAGAEVEIID
ncbi:MAG: L,D-transpeptidase family protein [Candidatus Omnitrophota bacterium]